MWMRAIGRALPGPRVVDATEFDAAPLRTLFVRYERIGDMIMATGLIRVLAKSSTRGKIDVVANSTTAPVLEGNPHVGKVFTLDRGSRGSYVRLMRQLRRERYDVIVDGRINNPLLFTSTPMLMLAARAPYRIGVGGGNNDLIYNVRVQQYDRSVPYIE
jgi:ADP-heptose:LPS heptosyltransferase